MCTWLYAERSTLSPIITAKAIKYTMVRLSCRRIKDRNAPINGATALCTAAKQSYNINSVSEKLTEFFITINQVHILR